jgi:penicillin amidase
MILIAAVLAAALLGGYVFYGARAGVPQTAGEIRLPGLKEPVQVLRDSFGIPHIYAANSHDLFMAQGYVHAQDRFYQMDFWRHLSFGRLSEMFGPGRVNTDKFLRTIGWGRVAKQELETVGPEVRQILQDYAEGVNAYMATHSGAQLGMEYSILALISPSYKPGLWLPEESLAWGKVMSWDLGSNMDAEIERAVLLKTLSVEQVNELFPLYPSTHPVILPDFKLADAAPAQIAALSGLTPDLTALRSRFNEVDALVGPRGDGIGSNNWVISGSRTASGKPLLANDPHLGPQLPSIWYENGLHCQQKNDACPYDVVGFSFPGDPGVIIGHNDRIAWGVTNVGPDVQDLYIEKINPANLDQYEVNGKWEDMQVFKETISISGGKTEAVTIRYTRHGPLIDQVYGKDSYPTFGVTLPEKYAVAVKWTALEPGTLFRSILWIDKARNWDEFRAAAKDWAVPSQNLIYADVDGNIGYQTPGLIPIRAKGDGRLPVPGWTDEYEWKGYIPFEKLPFTYNPKAGYVATANNAVVDSSYPYLLGTDWEYGYRQKRIVDLIEQAPGQIDAAYIQKMHGDNTDLNAANLVPYLQKLQIDNAGQQAARKLFDGWDYQANMDSAPAALFEAFWKHVLADTFDNKLPEIARPTGGSRWMYVMENLVKQPDSQWWDNPKTQPVENRDIIFKQALAEAVDELTKSLGSDPSKWKWGDLHTLTLQNQSLGQSGIAPIEDLFNRGPFRTAGGRAIVNATGWDTLGGFQVNWVPSMRMIVDLSDLTKSQTINLTGESGHPYTPHYTDQTDLWRMIQYHPMLWSAAQVQAAAQEKLDLKP